MTSQERIEADLEGAACAREATRRDILCAVVAVVENERIEAGADLDEACPARRIRAPAAPRSTRIRSAPR